MTDKLTLAEQRTPLARKLVEHCKNRLESLRQANDKDCDAVKTASIRGQISEIKRLQKMLEKTEPLIAVQDRNSPYM